VGVYGARVEATLPYAWYSEPEVLRREQERIFARSWQYVCPAGRVAEAGSYAAVRAGHVPVLLARDGAGELRGFVNVCRHRGSVLVDEDGRRGTIQCPYHAWTYDLDGSLRAAPRSACEPGFEPDELGLLPVAVDSWGPLVFVNPDADAAPLAEALGDLPALVADAGVDVDALAFHHRSESAYAANWKVCCENYLECYHCSVAHPGFSAVVDVSPDAYVLEQTSELLATQLGPLREPAGGEVERGQFHFLWPNLTVNVLPGRPNLSIGAVLPDAPERTSRFLDYFFAPDADPAWIEETLAWDDQVGREDTALVERVQRGVRTGLVAEGRLLSESERLVAHFDGLVRGALAD
jgi:phenylpropionate dioxygenase-like ring-hydroxylating dioxygenase large terminal subunit